MTYEQAVREHGLAQHQLDKAMYAEMIRHPDRDWNNPVTIARFNAEHQELVEEVSTLAMEAHVALAALFTSLSSSLSSLLSGDRTLPFLATPKEGAHASIQ